MLKKNKTVNKNSFILYVNQNPSSNSSSKIKLRKKSAIAKNIKIIKSLKHLNEDVLNKKENFVLNIKNINYNNNIKPTTSKQSIGINTSKHFDTLQTSHNNKGNKEDNYKEETNCSERAESKKNDDNNILNSSSVLYNKFFVGYNNNGEFIDNVKIKELRRNLKSFSYQKNIYKNKSNKNNRKFSKLNNNNKGSLLTYNFIKDAYSNEQKLLINISNNNLLFDKKAKNISKIKYKLKRQKTAINNYESIICPNINDNKTSSNKKRHLKLKQQLHKNRIMFNNYNYKLGNINNIFSIKNKEDKKNNLYIENQVCEYKHKNNKDFETKKELLKILDNPNSLLNYIYSQIQEYREHKKMLLHNRKKALRFKFENMKNDLKQIEQKAFYQVINLRYERIPGDEINIKTNIFCSK